MAIPPPSPAGCDLSGRDAWILVQQWFRAIVANLSFLLRFKESRQLWKRWRDAAVCPRLSHEFGIAHH